MAMKPQLLAEKIQEAMGQTDEKLSPENIALSKAIVGEIRDKAIVTFPPNTIKGTAPSSGGPLTKGEGANGVISGLTPKSLSDRIAKETGKGAATPQMLGFASGIVTHILAAEAQFPVGTITGPCTNTTNNPGALTGQGQKGLVKKLKGKDMAELIAKGLGQPSASPEVVKVCTAICEHIATLGEINISTPNVTAIASAGGGPIASGAGVGGKIS